MRYTHTRTHMRVCVCVSMCRPLSDYQLQTTATTARTIPLPPPRGLNANRVVLIFPYGIRWAAERRPLQRPYEIASAAIQFPACPRMFVSACSVTRYKGAPGSMPPRQHETNSRCSVVCHLSAVSENCL
jgi:hypothetical protein